MRNNNKNKSKKLKIKHKIAQQSDFDAQGSYTGVDASDKYEKPIQDADDL